MFRFFSVSLFNPFVFINHNNKGNHTIYGEKMCFPAIVFSNTPAAPTRSMGLETEIAAFNGQLSPSSPTYLTKNNDKIY